MIDDIIIEELDRLKLETPCELSGHSDYEAGIIQGRMEIINSLRQFIKPIPEDPVRDDLEQKAKEIATKWKAQGVPYNAIHEAVREMLSYQWQAYVHLIWKLSSANYEKGKEEIKQLIMKNAIDGTCISKGLESGCTIESPAGMLFYQHDRFDIGDRVKIITIKED